MRSTIANYCTVRHKSGNRHFDHRNGELLLSHDMMNFVLLITHIQNGVYVCVLVCKIHPGVYFNLADTVSLSFSVSPSLSRMSCAHLC